MLKVKMIIKKCLEYISSENFSLFLYGSSAVNILDGRDIDAIAISPDFDIVYCFSFEFKVGKGTKICNLYLVPDSVFLSDVYMLKFGGYYSHKFALTFNEILRKGHSLNAPLLFWISEYNCYLKTGNIIEDPELLIKTVHFKILKYRPTFVRPLMKFIDDTQRELMLRIYLKDCHVLECSTDCHFNIEFSDIFSMNQANSFYYFWSEYNKHKCLTSYWGEKTLLKMKYSLEDINFNLLNKYFSLH